MDIAREFDFTFLQIQQRFFGRDRDLLPVFGKKIDLDGFEYDGDNSFALKRRDQIRAESVTEDVSGRGRADFPFLFIRSGLISTLCRRWHHFLRIEKLNAGIAENRFVQEPEAEFSDFLLVDFKMVGTDLQDGTSLVAGRITEAFDGMVGGGFYRAVVSWRYGIEATT